MRREEVIALDKTSPDGLPKSQIYTSIRDKILGSTDGERLNFIQKSMSETSGWVSGFVGKHNLTSEKALDRVRRFVDVSDNRLDYLGAFFDLTTNYYTYTGTQSVARSQWRAVSGAQFNRALRERNLTALLCTAAQRQSTTFDDYL